MALGIVLVLASAIGIYYGKTKKNNGLFIGSIIFLIVVLALWAFFYYEGIKNPY